MAALQCEICGGKLIGKSAGRFVCDSCGMEYDSSWVKEKVQEIKGKVQIEGPVEVTGTVKIDGTVGGANVESLLIRGNNALKDERWNEAISYFDQVLNMDAKNVDAYWGLSMAQWNCKTREAFLRKYIYIEGDIGPFKYVWEYADENLRINLNKIENIRRKTLAELEDRREAKLKAQEEEQARQKAEQARKEQERIAFLQKQASILCPIRERLSCTKGILSAGHYTVAGVQINGIPLVSVNPYLTLNHNKKSDIVSWKNIDKIFSVGECLVGLTTNGEFVTTEYNANIEVHHQNRNRCEKNDLNSIIQIVGGGICLRQDGTVVVRDIGLRRDETVADRDRPQNEVQTWNNIVSVCALRDLSIGVRRDGTVVSSGYAHFRLYADECEEKVYPRISSWNNIVDAAIGYSPDDTFIIGLHGDGTIINWHTNSFRIKHLDFLSRVENWRDIIAVKAGFEYVFGLKADGTVITAGSDSSPKYDVSTWREIVAIEANGNSLFGLKSDGTVLSTNPAYDVSKWKLFNSFEELETKHLRNELNAQFIQNTQEKQTAESTNVSRQKQSGERKRGFFSTLFK